MKPEAQRIEIAEACPRIIGLSSSGAWMWKDSSDRWHCCYPQNDPLGDLNAIHEAEKEICRRGNNVTGLLFSALVEICGSEIDAAFATASQRAEAFLRTIGKWKEDE